MALAAAAVAPWRAALQASLTKNKHLPYAKFMQLATVTPDGGPACRTVVFRGFLQDTDDLTLVTDRRSHKVEQVAADPRGEVCWYFPESREQYRLTGTLQVVRCDSPVLQEARQAAWSNMSDAGRVQFTWPQPGLPRLDPNDFQGTAPPADGPPAEDFCLVVLSVKQVDYICLFTNKRIVYTSQSPAAAGTAALQWVQQEVNP